MKLLIILHHRFDLWTAPSWFAERLRRDFPGIEVEEYGDYKEAEPHLVDADILVTWSLRSDQARMAGKLKWIHSPAAAVHLLMIPDVVNSDIAVTNASEVHGAVVAEHVIALIFAMAKRLPSIVRHQRERKWSQEDLWRERPRPREVTGATVGMLGLGTIGSEVARRTLALGMKVVAVREHPEKNLPLFLQPYVNSGDNANSVRLVVYGKDRLQAMLSEADYVVLAAPLLENTRAVINAENLLCMKNDACLINVARGGLVDEDALVDSLRNRRIGGAALDVFQREPLPSDSPLWDIENVLITPHSAALAEKLWDRHYDLLARNLRHFLAGTPLIGLVDKKLGY